MIRYTVGDATRPECVGPAIIAHICNDSGRWGKGFVVALSRRWKAPERDFRSWAGGLGELQLVEVEPQLWVANMVAQHKVATARSKGPPPIRYEALEACLSKLAEAARARGAEVHMPRIGAGLAGGDWNIIEGIIERKLVGLTVVVYDLG